MNITNVETNATITSNVRTQTKSLKSAYGTQAERLSMTSDVKALFAVGSTYVETDTGTVYIFDGVANDFVEF